MNNKRRRRQGVPTPLKAAAAIAMLAIVLWTGWTVLGPDTTLAENGQPAEQGSNAAAENADTASREASDPALDAILGDSGRAAPRNTSLLAAAIDTQDPVSESALPEPEVIESNPGRFGSVAVDPVRLSQVLPSTNNRTTADPAQTPSGSSLVGAPRAMLDADMLVGQGKLIEARALLNTALLASSTSESDRAQLRTRLSVINETLVFGPNADAADAMSETYKVQPNDSLARIASRRELATHYKLIARVNGIKDPSKIRVGQRLKLVRGPFHAVIDKSDFRMDIYHGAPDSPSSWVYITSRSIGLGEKDGTPVGSFVISNNKLENPGWVNPRDSSIRFDRNDPANPIGEYWLGLDGIGPSAVHVSLGIHGTIEPESIGRAKSMGCVRLGSEDIALVYELLVEQVSVVHIVE